MEHLEHPIDVLIKSEAVLYKRISRMKTGKPRTEALERLNQIKDAIKVLTRSSRAHREDNLL
jgi:hypothetical protein